MNRNLQSGLSGVESHLSPRQHVFAIIEEARAAGSILEFSRRRVKSNRHHDSLLVKIERSLAKSHPHTDDKQRSSLVWKAQKRASYLFKLWCHCNLSVVAKKREWMYLRCCLILLAVNSNDEAAGLLPECVDAMLAHWAELENFRVACDSISRDEFGGSQVLLPVELALLTSEIDALRPLIPLLKENVSANRAGALAKPIDSSTAGLAASWRLLVRAQISIEFENGDACLGLLGPLLIDNGDYEL